MSGSRRVRERLIAPGTADEHPPFAVAGGELRHPRRGRGKVLVVVPERRQRVVPVPVCAGRQKHNVGTELGGPYQRIVHGREHGPAVAAPSNG